MKQLMLHKDREAYSIGLQPSMSLAAHLLECSFAFSKELEPRTSGEPARYGLAFHELIAGRIVATVRAEDGVKTIHQPSISKVAKRFEVGDKEEELRDHVAAGFSTLTSWLRKNEFKIDFGAVRKKGGALLIEAAVALKPLESGRIIEPHDEEHRYHGLELGEQPGTLDFAITPAKRMRRKLPVLVLDHKTGEMEDYSRPLDKAQLLSLGAAVMRMTDSEEAIVGVLHARRRGMPKVYADRVKLSELKQYERRIQVSLGRIGDGSMRPGAWCRYCPAQTVCPARDSELLNKAGDMLTGLTAAGGALSKEGLTANDVVVAKAPASLARDKKLGILYEIARKAEALAQRVREEIKLEILTGNGAVLPETPSGEYLIVRTYEKEAISKKSIIDAYGRLGGERRLKQLRADGAITKTKVEQLWPEKERGR